MVTLDLLARSSYMKRVLSEIMNGASAQRVIKSIHHGLQEPHQFQ